VHDEGKVNIWKGLGLTGQAMNIQNNIDVCSCNHCGSQEAICTAYSECVFVGLILSFGHPCCVCNNEVEYNESQNTTKFIG